MAIKHPDHWKKEYEKLLAKLEMESQMIDQNTAAQAMGSIIGTSTTQGLYQNALTTGVGAGQLLMQQNTPKEAPKYECGVLYLNGAPLPDDWRGAYTDRIERSMAVGDNPRWIFNFKSKWGSEIIVLHLDAEKMSGEEATRVAETYKEALNQRRVG